MLITKEAVFKKDFYGGKAYLSGDETVKRWLESQQNRLLHPRFRELKDAIGNENKLEEILSVFNVDENGHPIIGNWMLLECSLNAQKLAGTWNKYKVSRDQWKDSVSFSPDLVELRNGKKIKRADDVEVYSISTKSNSSGKRVSFFKAYQLLKVGTSFSFTISVPDDLCEKVEGRGKDKIFTADVEKTKECVNEVLDKMQIIGLGAYRLRFGKFKYV